MMLMSPRSGVESPRALDSAAAGPRFSFGSKTSELEGLDEYQRMDCSSVHGSEASAEHKALEASSHPSSVHWKHSLSQSTRAPYAQDIMRTGDTIDENETEVQRLVHGQCGGDTRRRANTDSTLKVDDEACSRALQTCELPRHAHSSAVSDASANSPRQDLHLKHPNWHNSPRNRSTGINIPPAKAKAQEISKAVASEVTSCLHNQISADEIELIIQTRVMSLLSDGTTKKRKTGDTDNGNDGIAQPSSKRITCRSCPKTVGRPCDLK